MNSVDKAILANIAENGDGYGLELGERLQMGASIYGHLRDLERKGYLSAYEVNPGIDPRQLTHEEFEARGYRSRHYYKLTDAGRAALQAS